MMIEGIENVFEQVGNHYKELFFDQLLTKNYIHSLKREY